MFLEAYNKVIAYEAKRKRGEVIRRPLQIKALEMLENEDSNIYLVNAPTGYGKSVISMSVALREFERDSKVIIAYPLKTLIEEQVDKMKEMFDFHNINKQYIGARHAGLQESLYLVHPVTLTTIDTLSLTAMGLSPEDIKSVIEGFNLGHYLFSWSSVYTSSFIVLDEVHLMYDSTKSLSFLNVLMDLCESTGVKTLLMTASFPKIFEKALTRKMNKIIFSRDEDANFYNERLSKKYRIELKYLQEKNKLQKIKEILESNDFKRALVLFNTVKDAVEFYKLINGKKILLHSRFTEEDKKSKIEELKKMKISNDRYIVVGTQAVEAGIDISSDLIITEIAPPISLVQRFGRFLRYEEREGKAFVWVAEEKLDNEKSFYTVYIKDLVKRTLNYLSNNGDLNLHVSHDEFMNAIYIEEPYVDNKLIQSFLNIFNNLLNPSESAIKKFIEQGGSFVRDGSFYTVVTENNYEVIVSFDYLTELIEKGLCLNCPKRKEEILKRSLMGDKFKVRVNYDKELGLI